MISTLPAFGAGDSYVQYDFIDASKLVENEQFDSNNGNSLFNNLLKEVAWEEMKHRGGSVPRLVAVQGELNENGHQPIYRHPMDEQPPLEPFTPTIKFIRDQIQELTHQPINHCLIQLYRNGKDNISEHCDKTLDILKGSSILSFSAGASRTIILKSKDKKKNNIHVSNIENKIILKDNTLFALGWESNKKFLHGINPDKRMDSLKRDDELLYNCQRISLTFRTIATFMTSDNQLYGQGAIAKSFEELLLLQANEVITVANSIDFYHYIANMYHSELELQKQHENAMISNIKENLTQTADLNHDNNNNNNNNNNKTIHDDHIMYVAEENGVIIGNGEEDELQVINSWESRSLLTAFSAENKLIGFNWDRYYSRGFQINNIKIKSDL
eukprot:gene4511-6373_t